MRGSHPTNEMYETQESTGMDGELTGTPRRRNKNDKLDRFMAANTVHSLVYSSKGGLYENYCCVPDSRSSQGGRDSVLVNDGRLLQSIRVTREVLSKVQAKIQHVQKLD